MKRIGVLCSGGDAPGMNAAVRAIVRTARSMEIAVTGFLAGYDGMIDKEWVDLNSLSVSGIINRGGTILRSGRSVRFREPAGRAEAVANARDLGVEGLIVIGGDGSLTGADLMANETDFPVIGLPGTIDNDLAGTDYTIGFDTAINTALDAIDKIRDTAYSHDRVFVIEVMGRHKGFIALEVGLAGGAEAVLIPEKPHDLEAICAGLAKGKERGKISSIIVVAEGAAKAEDVANFINGVVSDAARYLVLGHMQRGGSPTSFDRVLATRLGDYAVKLIAEGHTREMAGVEGDRLVYRSFRHVLSADKRVDPERVRLAEVMGR